MECTILKVEQTFIYVKLLFTVSKDIKIMCFTLLSYVLCNTFIQLNDVSLYEGLYVNLTVQP